MTDCVNPCADIAVAILAAGLGRRFGSDKLMVSLDGFPLGAHIARTVAPMGFGWRFAVCADDAPIAIHFSALDFDIIDNEEPHLGQALSLHLAVAAAQQTTATALMVVLADMPFVSTAHIVRISQCGALAASHNGAASMPPALFPRMCWPDLLKTRGDAGARPLLGAAHMVHATVDELRDIDARADLPRAHVP